MTNQEAKELIKAIYDEDQQLNEWEQSFLKSVGEQLDKGWPPSQKQAEKIRQIYENVTDIKY